MPRYKTKIKMWLEVNLDAEDVAVANEKARGAMMDVDFRAVLKKATPEGCHLQVSYGPLESTEEVKVLDYKLAQDPRTRLYEIYANCFKHNGPRVPMTPEMLADARAAFSEITDERDRLEAPANFSNYGVELGEIKWPKAVFSGEWFGYVNPTGTAKGPHQYALGFRGYDSGHRWNGWACPEVPLETVEALVAWQDKLSADQKEGIGQIKIVPQDGAVPRLEVSDPCGDEVTVVAPTRVHTVDGDQILYDIGLGWCWEILEPTKDHVCEIQG